MNEDIEIYRDECDSLIPKAVLVAYSNESYKTYLETREIRRDGSMGPAKPVSKDFIQNLLSGFSKEYRNIPSGMIPENLLYCDTRTGNETYIWYNKPRIRRRYFTKSLGLEDGNYHVPGTIYKVKNGELSVFCFKGEKPETKDTLLGVPYFNVYQSGKVCMGSAIARIPDKDNLSYDDVTKAWEDAFWNSVDVHTNGSPSTKGNLVETIKKYRNTKFDTSELEQRNDGLTLEKLLKNDR